MRDVVQAIDTALILKDIAAENDGEAAHQPLLRISPCRHTTMSKAAM